MLSLKRFIKSLTDALRGLKFVFKSEQNFRIQVVFGFFGFTRFHLFPIADLGGYSDNFNGIAGSFGGNFGIQLLNILPIVKTAFASLCLRGKRFMAGAVLLSSVVAFDDRVDYLLPHFINLFK